MQNQINFSPITLFIQQVKSSELTKSKEVKMPIEQARLLSLTLAEMSTKLNQNYETLLFDVKQLLNNQVVTVELDGGGFDSEK